ncbi:precorrin-6A reductase [Blautia sp. NSJ-166]|uniref:precorrin-6A reductase n=1 Tax=Blautia sp. NSJ-166 TaxID=2931882 RepID=UPI000E4CCDB1|nr:precorrin-6A reductase [Blautia sp. NSJ-166]MCJ8046105.1 precorrin-6A reductase [Blautia sp. NSJ-166]RGF88114.1 precorrin-6A reductase [Ruminococcus sp. OF03-6AA]RGH50453.1 precorrin-6A reductase [Ruminococcus sp. AM36-5]RGH56653.1 precorrin-6A reductase [Ruminococcus sp. AM36-2AA]
MYKAIVFAGTTEGYALCEFLAENRVSVYACAATEYGGSLLQENEFLHVSAGRLKTEDMEELFRKENPEIVLDATHPYAAEVTKNIRTACESAGVLYQRILRPEGEKNSEAIYVESTEEAAAFLSGTEGNIFLTTGSKELAKFTGIPDYKERLFARVLSIPSVIRSCAELGIEGKHLIGMQGPFSAEINEAMLRQFQCSYLVTKDTGLAGGFPEKMEACQRCGVTPVIIGRPLKEEGLSLQDARVFLSKMFGFTLSQKISLVGIGMGAEKTLTLEGKKALNEAELLIGAKRMTEAVQKPGQMVLHEYRSEKIVEYIREHPKYRTVAIALSGDVGFYSGAKKLIDQLDGNVEVICGISSVVYFMSKIGLSWDDAKIVSAHGRNCNLISLIRHNPKVFSILGTEDGVAVLASRLVYYGMGDVTLYVGENLSYENEKIFHDKAANLTEYRGDALSVVTACNEKVTPMSAVHGISDGEFLRGKAPMTKEEVRTVSLSKLRLSEDSVCYDVGAGTGSVSVEMALRAWMGQVYAIEKKEDALALLKENKKKFAVDNLAIIPGVAPEAMTELPAPTHAFIGGSSGNMQDIINLLLEKNPKVRIVINCITLETVTEAMNAIRDFGLEDVDIVQLAAARSKSIGRYHMMMGENPIYIISCSGRGEEIR